MKIVGLMDARDMKRKRDGQLMNAWVVYYTAPGGRNVIGEEAQQQFVDADMLTDVLADAGGLAPADLVGRECDMLWDRRGFLTGLVLRPVGKK